MKLEILSVHGTGDYLKEYVLLEALADCDVGRYMIADSTYMSDGKVSNKVRHTFWIPDRQVRAGDLVSVWTKPGDHIVTKNAQGRTIHRFFWGLREAVWNDTGDCAVLFELSTWAFAPVPATTSAH